MRTKAGAAFDAGLVVLAIGVRPESSLAREAGLEIGDRGGIRVDSQMRTSDPHIWAVGDAVEVRNRVTGQWELIPLAGPANRQGRIAADVICGRDSRFSSVQATAVCGFFGLTVALTGATEKTLRRAGIEDFKAVYLHPAHHAGYYPGAKPIHLKLLFRGSDGLLLGAQAVGEEGVERRIDVIAMAIQMGATVFDLEEAELCYAPQYGSAKDPVNLAGMVASNVMRGDIDLASWPELETAEAFLLDVREVKEFHGGYVEGAVNIPLGKLRTRLNELPRDREIWIYCRSGSEPIMLAGSWLRTASGSVISPAAIRRIAPGARRSGGNSAQVESHATASCYWRIRKAIARPLTIGLFCLRANNAHGLQIRFQRQDDGEMTATWTPSSVWEGFRGIVHGGVVSTVLDEAMSKAVAATGAEALTAELRVRFRRHVTSGHGFSIRGWMVSQNKRMIKTEAILIAAGGTEHAHAWATFLTLPHANEPGVTLEPR